MTERVTAVTVAVAEVWIKQFAPRPVLNTRPLTADSTGSIATLADRCQLGNHCAERLAIPCARASIVRRSLSICLSSVSHVDGISFTTLNQLFSSGSRSAGPCTAAWLACNPLIDSVRGVRGLLVRFHRDVLLGQQAGRLHKWSVP
jgi:hypothetical protein